MGNTEEMYRPVWREKVHEWLQPPPCNRHSPPEAGAVYDADYDSDGATTTYASAVSYISREVSHISTAPTSHNSVATPSTSLPRLSTPVTGTLSTTSSASTTRPRKKAPLGSTYSTHVLPNSASAPTFLSYTSPKPTSDLDIHNNTASSDLVPALDSPINFGKRPATCLERINSDERPCEINAGTHRPHITLSRKVTSRFPPCFPPHTSDHSNVLSIARFTETFLAFEEIWESLVADLQNPALEDTWDELDKAYAQRPSSSFSSTSSDGAGDNDVISFLRKLRPPNRMCSAHIRRDVAFLQTLSSNDGGTNFQAMATRENQSKATRAFTLHIRTTVKEKPYLLIAYSWKLYRNGLPSPINLETWLVDHLSNNSKALQSTSLTELQKILNDYRTKLCSKLSIKDNPERQFAPVGTAHDFLEPHRLEKLFGAAFSPLDSVGQPNGTKGERTKQLVAKVKASPVLENIVATLIFMRCTSEDLLRLEIHYALSDPPNNFPLPFHTTSDLFGEDSGELFYRNQFIFAPFTFVEDRENDFSLQSGQPRRLPILWRTRIGGGAGGDVFEVEIEKGGWRGTNGHTNNERIRLALKVFKGDHENDRKQAWQEEWTIHDQIRKAYTQHKHVAYCRGRLKQDNEYSLFFDLADHTLEDVLTKEDIAKKYSRFCLLDRTAEICSGLAYLHEGLLRYGRPTTVCHLDFRPPNILAFEDRRVWKVNDFDLSRVKHPKPDSGASPEWTTDRRGDGTFVSPEASLKGRVTAVSDLWSLAAVIIEMLTSVLGGPKLVKEFRAMRKQDGEQGIRHDQFFVKENNQASVNPKVSFWCEELRLRAAQEDETLGQVFSHGLDFLESSVLIVDEKKRCETSANEIGEVLYRMSSNLKDGPRIEPTGIASAFPQLELPASATAEPVSNTQVDDSHRSEASSISYTFSQRELPAPSVGDSMPRSRSRHESQASVHRAQAGRSPFCRWTRPSLLKQNQRQGLLQRFWEPLLSFSRPPPRPRRRRRRRL